LKNRITVKQGVFIGCATLLQDNVAHFVKEAGIKLLCEKIEEGLSVTTREDEDNRYVFVQNFCDKAVPFKLTSSAYQVLSGNYDGTIGSYETVVFTAKK
jgi:hypothetical protein